MVFFRLHARECHVLGSASLAIRIYRHVLVPQQSLALSDRVPCSCSRTSLSGLTRVRDVSRLNMSCVAYHYQTYSRYSKFLASKILARNAYLTKHFFPLEKDALPPTIRAYFRRRQRTYPF